jgi:hypothetical protein
MAKEMFDWLEFDDYIADVCNEANYWMGYKKLFVKVVDDEMYLDDGLALTKKASSIKVAVYRLVKERRELLEKRGTIPGPEFEKELERIEKLIAVKGYEIASLRRKFVEFMEEWDPEMELRTRFNQRKNPMEDEIEDD